jgi:hypothetical protein
MPDLTVETAYTCLTNEHWVRKVAGSDGSTHTVRFCRQPHGPVQYDYECSCLGFKYRRTCRHIRQVDSERCGWNAGLEVTLEPDHAANGEPICPNCGGPVRAVRVGV